MKLATIVGLALVLCVITLVSISSSAQSASPTGVESEPITGDPVMPNPGSETPQHNPFTQFDTGPDPWSYDQLETDELRAQVDRGRDVTGWSDVHSAYSAATDEAAADAQAQVAQHKLGLEGLDTTGVVP
jgi:hypothetical protein